MSKWVSEVPKEEYKDKLGVPIQEGDALVVPLVYRSDPYLAIITEWNYVTHMYSIEEPSILARIRYPYGVDFVVERIACKYCLIITEQYKKNKEVYPELFL